MKKVPVTLSDVSEAMTMFDGLSEAAAYLDLKTGEVIPVFDEMDTERDGEYANLDERTDEFLYIEPINSRDGFQIMESFVDDLDEGEVKRALSRDLQRSRPFRNFKDTLLDFPESREAYFTHYVTETEKLAQRFLKENGIEVS